jgi:hypothetical protein
MQEEEFKQLLLSATDQAKQFASNYIKNNLPVDNAYHIRLSVSHDDPTLTQFDIYPEDNGKIVEMADVATVVATLLRKEKVPVWIDISVLEICKGKTVLSLLCAGRYSDNIKELYYLQRDLGPFGVKSPNLPLGYKEGLKFQLPERGKSLWKNLFVGNRR